MVNEWQICHDCGKKWPVTGADKACPFCQSTHIDVFGDSEDIDATTNDYTDQFKQKGTKSGLLGSGMKEIDAEVDQENRGQVEELKPDENWHVDLTGLPDALQLEEPIP